MESFIYFILTLIIAAIGGLIGKKLKLPAGVLLGAMVATVAFNLLTEKAVFYQDIRIVIQVLAGAMIGSQMDRAVVFGMKKLVLPIILLVASMLVLNLVFGSLMYLFSPLDAATALFAAAPGGASDMAIIAADLGAATEYVAILQLSRLIIIFTCMPPIVKRIMKKMQLNEQTKNSDVKSSDYDLDFETSSLSLNSAENLSGTNAKESITKLLQLISSAATGILFYLLGVTAGAIIGGMVGGTIYCVLKGKVAFPSKLKTWMQVGAGVFIGIRVERAILMSLGGLAVPLFIMFIGVFVFAFGTAFLMHKLTKLDFITCLLASTPGGQQEMALLSEDLDADTPSVAIMQTARLVCVIAFFPTLLELILILV